MHVTIQLVVPREHVPWVLEEGGGSGEALGAGAYLGVNKILEKAREPDTLPGRCLEVMP